MRRLLPLLLFVFTLPALASLFDSRPASTLGKPLNNSSAPITYADVKSAIDDTVSDAVHFSAP